MGGGGPEDDARPWNRPAFPGAPRRFAEVARERITGALGERPGIEALFPVFAASIELRRRAVDAFVWQTFGATVQSGPFKGVAYIPRAWGSLFAPKLLGTYEAELHPVFSRLDRYDRFVDVGSAEGYYAVGSAVAASHIEVFAFDSNAAARGSCAALAEANGVADRVHLGAWCDGALLAELAGPRTLVLIDIEGGEADLVGDAGPERLADADIVVETHSQGLPRPTADAVEALLASTHDVEIVTQTARDPALFPPLMRLRQLDRFLAQWEGRGADPWIVARSRTGRAAAS